MRRFTLRVISVVALVSSAASCTDGVTSGHDRIAKVAIVPELSLANQSIFRSLSSFALGVDNVHIVMFRPSTETALVDTIVPFPVTSSQIAISIAVQLDAAEETLSAFIELRSATTVLFSGSQSVTARVGQTTTQSEPVVLSYVGPGSTATKVTITPRAPSTFAGGTVPLVATASDAQGAVVADFPITWSTLNASIATVNDNGIVSGVAAGTISVVARGITGIADTVPVLVTAPAAQLVLVSGDAQRAIVGQALTAPFVVHAATSAGVPVPGFPISFHVTSGSATLANANARTDDKGNAQTPIVLGTKSGDVTIEASSGSLAAVSVHATALPDVATALKVVSGDNQTALAGTVLPAPLVVRAEDQYGNPVPGTSVIWGDGASGQLSAFSTTTGADGTTSVTYAVGQSGTVFASFSNESGQVNFAVTALPGPVNQLLQVAFPSAQLGLLSDVGPAVQVADSYGNPIAVANVQVSFSFTSSDTSSTFSPNQARSVTALTDSRGIATAPQIFMGSQHDIQILATATIGTTRIQGLLTVFFVQVLPNRTPANVNALSAPAPSSTRAARRAGLP